jgi:hypothetical protein
MRNPFPLTSQVLPLHHQWFNECACLWLCVVFEDIAKMGGEDHDAVNGIIIAIVNSCVHLTSQQERCCNRILPHTFIGRAWLQRWSDPKPRTGAALGEACLTPGLVVLRLCLPPHLHAYIWLVNFSLIWLVNVSLIWLVNFSLIWLVNSQNLILAKKLYCLCMCGGQRKPAPPCNSTCGFPHIT